MAHGDEEDPARRFLDQTVPRDDAWDGREPEEGPARPRHVQYPTEPDSMRTAKERRKDAIRNAAWTSVGMSASQRISVTAQRRRIASGSPASAARSSRPAPSSSMRR